MENLSLSKIEAVRFALEAAITVQEVKEIRDATVAMHLYAEQQRVGQDIQQKIAEYVVRAERKLGEILKAAKAAGQISFDHGNQYKRGVEAQDTPKVKLSEAGIPRDLSSRSQRIASIPEAEFEEKIEELKEEGTISPNALLRMCRQAEKEEAATLKPHRRQKEVAILHDNGKTNAQIASELNMGERAVRHVTDRIKVERNVAPEVTLDMISSMSQKERYQRLVQQYEEQFQARVMVEAHKLAIEQRDQMLESTLRHLREDRDRLSWAIKNRLGVMTRKDYMLILACLHSDRTDHFVMDQNMRNTYLNAFRLMTKAEKILLDERNSPTTLAPIPSVEELKANIARGRGKKPKGGDIQPI
jgi:DNA-binding NarL/FixJ family response regulator